MRLFKTLLTILLATLPLLIFGQNAATLSGRVTDEFNRPVELANVSILNIPGGTITNKQGEYQLAVPANKEFTVVISFIGYKSQRKKLKLKTGEHRKFNTLLPTETTMLPDVIVEDQILRSSTLTPINPKTATSVPSISGSVESLVKTMPGVASNNELSSQYSVRGGNFDENLIYVNDVQIYRPFLVRSGQQEGLSFLNSDLVSSILFSAGGFEAKYGDKMSSVLDIRYRKPLQFSGSVQASLLGASLHIEDLSKNKKFSYLLGVRQKSNQYLLNNLETKGDYKPSFTDIQTLLRYQINNKLELSLLGNYSRNRYQLSPETRQTDFGTIQEAYRLTIYFDGREVDKFENYLGALTATYQASEQLKLKFITSTFYTDESENFDILGQYWIGRLETNFGGDEFGQEVASNGVGSDLNHARNQLKARVFTIEHRGNWTNETNFLEWGVKYQNENVDDRVNEWRMIDSAGYSLPHPPDHPGYTPGTIGAMPNFNLDFWANTNVNMNTNRYSAFVQNNFKFSGDHSPLMLSAGIRTAYWDFTDELLFSPRATLSYRPKIWDKDVMFRFSSGVYYQPPFYREIRDIHGKIYDDVKSQQSIHFVAGSDWNFIAWNRPFKFVSEVYYKALNHLIPYEVDNVRIRYFPDLSAKGYATGMDFKINGEFVRGIESWLSLSLLKTEENIDQDYYVDPSQTDASGLPTSHEIGYRPRPADQIFNFNLFFQDFLPQNPTYQMHLNLVYGSPLPIGILGTKNYKPDWTIPAYRRVDIGFSKQLIGEISRFSKNNPLRHFKSMWLSLEVFNLLQTNNTVSYIWVKDVSNRQYAVPNYLTPRQLNLKLVAKF